MRRRRGPSKERASEWNGGLDQKEARQEYGARGGKAIKSLGATLDHQPVLEWRNVARTDCRGGPDKARGEEEKKARREGLGARTLDVGREEKRFVEEGEERLFEKTAVASAQAHTHERFMPFRFHVQSIPPQSRPCFPGLFACPPSPGPVEPSRRVRQAVRGWVQAWQGQGKDGMR